MIIDPIKNIVDDLFYILYVGGVFVIVGLVIFLGLKYSTGGYKDAKRLKNWLPWLLIGLVIIILAEFVPNLLKTFFDFSQ